MLLFYVLYKFFLDIHRKTNQSSKELLSIPLKLTYDPSFLTLTFDINKNNKLLEKAKNTKYCEKPARIPQNEI